MCIVNKASGHKYCGTAHYLNSANPVHWMKREEWKKELILPSLFAFTQKILLLLLLNFWKLSLPALVNFQDIFNMQLKDCSSNQQEVSLHVAPKLLLATSMFWFRSNSRQLKRVHKYICSSEHAFSVLPHLGVKEPQLTSVRKLVLIRKPYCIFWHWK